MRLAKTAVACLGLGAAIVTADTQQYGPCAIEGVGPAVVVAPRKGGPIPA